MSLGACCCRCCLFTVLVNLLAAKGHGALSDLSLLKCDLPPSLIRRSLSCSLALSLFRSAFLLSLSLSRSEPEDLLHSQSDMATLHIYLFVGLVKLSLGVVVYIVNTERQQNPTNRAQGL